jgi:transcriptional antiterminator RfaH
VLAQDSAWYVVRTRQHKERFVKQQALEFIEDAYLPLFRTKVRYRGKVFSKIEPLFPCYLFARFSQAKANYKIRHCPNVSDIVSAGGEPCEVAGSTISAIKNREVNGLIVLKQTLLQPLERVSVTEGPFNGIEALFERYLSGTERVAVLLDSLGGGSARAVLSADSISPIRVSRSRPSA